MGVLPETISAFFFKEYIQDKITEEEMSRFVSIYKGENDFYTLRSEQTVPDELKKDLINLLEKYIEKPDRKPPAIKNKLHYTIVKKGSDNVNIKTDKSLLLLRVYDNKREKKSIINLIKKWVESSGNVFAVADPWLADQELRQSKISDNSIRFHQILRTGNIQALKSTLLSFASVTFLFLFIEVFRTFFVVGLVLSLLGFYNLGDKFPLIYSLVFNILYIAVSIKVIISKSYSVSVESVSSNTFDFINSNFNRSASAVLKSKGSIAEGYSLKSIYCYNSTWKYELELILSGIDFVVMDLRNFAEKNKGCIFEISYIMSYMPLDHIIFLIDHQTDEKFVKDTLADAFNKRKNSADKSDIKSFVRLLFTDDLHDSVATTIQNIFGVKAV